MIQWYVIFVIIVCKPVQNSCILRLLKLSGVSRSTVLRANPVFELLYLSHVKTLKMTGSNYFYGRKFYFISCMSLAIHQWHVNVCRYCTYLAPLERVTNKCSRSLEL